jgi:hypothetical protein
MTQESETRIVLHSMSAILTHRLQPLKQRRFPQQQQQQQQQQFNS